MSLTARYGKNVKQGVTCQNYSPKPNSKRCEHYQDGGTCILPDEFLCSEWQKANAGRVPSGNETQPSAKTEKRLDTDLLGQPLPKPIQKSTPVKTEVPQPEAKSKTEHVEPVLIRGLTDADIASFKALNVEVSISNDNIGEVWLVPEYTGKDRKEISCEDAAFITSVCATFPGAKITSFEKMKETLKPQEKQS